MASLTEIGPVFLGKMKILKVHTSQTGLKTNDGQQMNRKAPLNFQYRWAKKLIAYLDPTLRKVSLIVSLIGVNVMKWLFTRLQYYF